MSVFARLINNESVDRASALIAFQLKNVCNSRYALQRIIPSVIKISLRAFFLLLLIILLLFYLLLLLLLCTIIVITRMYIITYTTERKRERENDKCARFSSLFSVAFLGNLLFIAFSANFPFFPLRVFPGQFYSRYSEKDRAFVRSLSLPLFSPGNSTRGDRRSNSDGFP